MPGLMTGGLSRMVELQMSTELLNETRLSEQPGTTSQPSGKPAAKLDLTPPAASRASGRLWKRGLLLIVPLALLAAAVTLISGAISTRESSNALTHTIQRGDLVVTVTEQGTLESSENTEIKCKVKGGSTVLSVIEAGTEVKPGDLLVQLDTSAIDDKINEQKIAYQKALATHATSETNVSVARIAVTEYLEGTYRSALKTLQKDLAIARSNLRSAQNIAEHTARMFRKGYSGKLEVEASEYTLQQAQLELELKETEIDALERFTRAKMLEELRSKLKAAEATLASDTAALELERARLDREEQQLANCVIKAETGGIVIHPLVPEWREEPDIEEGATVREDQVLLLIPDLSRMQVKVGVHESKVDRIKVGTPARVRLLDETFAGKVASVATVTQPAGWWTGNVVKYDTMVELDSHTGADLKPGMSVEVELMLARHEDVLLIPVAAVAEQEKQFFCWVKTPSGMSRRELELGDSNDQFIVVKDGLKEGDEVVLNPRAHIDEAQAAALKPVGETPIVQAADPDGTAPAANSAASPAAAKSEESSAAAKPAESSSAPQSGESTETAAPAAAKTDDSGGAQP
jgi:RND family efflux transporter MFP subunit